MSYRYMATFVPTEVGVHDVFVAARGSPDGSDESQEGALIEKSYQTRICNAKVCIDGLPHFADPVKFDVTILMNINFQLTY